MAARYAGVTLDWFDDQGDTLKQKFPTLEDVPEIIKEADIRPKEKLANEDFALIALDEGRVMRKYACHDAGTTAMSVIYFMEHGHKLPEEAQKMAAANLITSCLQNNMVPPRGLVKQSGLANWVTKPFVQALKPEIREAAQIAGRESVTAGSKALQDELAKAVLRASAATALGSAAGGMTAPSGDRVGGAMRGAAGGLVGGVLGGSLGRVIKPSMGTNIGGGLGAALVGAMGGATKGGIQPRAAFSVPGLEVALGSRKEEPKETPLEPQQPNIQVIAPGGDEKMASARVVDITGKQAPAKIKSAAPKTDDDYAVVLPDGSRHYPINTWDKVKTAEVYYQESSMRMQPEIRRQYATKLAAKAKVIGYPLDEEIKEAGASTYADADQLKDAIEMRKVACAPGGDERTFLDELFEKRASLSPEVYSEVLRRFDVDNGLDRGWDKVVLDPWASTYGMTKTAEIVWEDGAERVTAEELTHLALEHGGALRDVYGESFTDQFMKDPVGLFESLPLPHKRQVARLAQNMTAIGSTENNVTFAKK